MNHYLKTACILPMLLTGACATITGGGQNTVAVSTTPLSGAACDLRNGNGQWQVAKTPGIATVSGAHGDLVITCEHPDGGKGVTSLVSSTNGAAFGNILAGGIIGAAVDMSSGAAYRYPSATTVALVDDAAYQQQLEQVQTRQSAQTEERIEPVDRRRR